MGSILFLSYLSEIVQICLNLYRNVKILSEIFVQMILNTKLNLSQIGLNLLTFYYHVSEELKVLLPFYKEEKYFVSYSKELEAAATNQILTVLIYTIIYHDCSKWIGESERQLRLLFDQAYIMRPSIIFFDEIDGLAPVRSSRSDQIHSSIVSTLLALMDGLDNR